MASPRPSDHPPLPAVFLDRDGTLVDDPGFLKDPGDVRLLDGAAQAIARLNGAGLLVIVVTNQGGIARGLLTEEDYARVAARVGDLLRVDGAHVDATYHCPHFPAISGPCDCRKPGLAHYRDAARRFGITFASSWFVGDRPSDLQPAAALGGRGILVCTGHGREHEKWARSSGFQVADDLGDAVSIILATPPA
ncbi:MAG: D-glycero-alpha-D-manno-heptose-1,7-bisphosphate 7-phosphatase [Gemmatimonadota bacterium]